MSQNFTRNIKGMSRNNIRERISQLDSAIEESEALIRAQEKERDILKNILAQRGEPAGRLGWFKPHPKGVEWLLAYETDEGWSCSRWSQRESRHYVYTRDRWPDAEFIPLSNDEINKLLEHDRRRFVSLDVLEQVLDVVGDTLGHTNPLSEHLRWIIDK